MANHDVLMDTASYHGTRIKTGIPSKEYQDNWEVIWGTKKISIEEAEKLWPRDEVKESEQK